MLWELEGPDPAHPENYHASFGSVSISVESQAFPTYHVMPLGSPGCISVSGESQDFPVCMTYPEGPGDTSS